MSATRDGFLARWSRLKRDGEPVQPVEARPAPSPDPADLPDGASLADLIAALPRVEELLPGQSLAVFMQSWVPGAVRNAALQRMWLLDPAIRDYVNPALDYAYDYNTPGAAPGFGPMETSEEAVREVADMFDRALGRQTPNREDHAASERDEDPLRTPADAGHPDDETPDRSVPVAAKTDALRMIEASAVPDPGDVAPRPVASVAASHDGVHETMSPRPRASRHGGALPG